MDLYIITLTIVGVVVLLTAWLPMVMRRLPLSLPIACLAIGALLAWSPFPLLPRFNPHPLDADQHRFGAAVRAVVD
jgi:hypothetical protein